MKWLRIFYIYRWGLHKIGSTGYYVYGSLRKYSQLENLQRYKYKLKRGRRVHGIIIRTHQWNIRNDGSIVRCWDNGIIVFRRGFKPRGIKFYGPVCREVGRLRVLSLFKTVI